MVDTKSRIRVVKFSMHNLWSMLSHLQANLDVLFAPEFNMPGEFKAGPGDVAKLVCREVDTIHGLKSYNLVQMF